MTAGPPARPALRLGVVGAGTMGAGIAQVGVLAGFACVLHDADEHALNRGLRAIEGELERGAERGRLTVEASAAARRRLHGSVELAALADCDLIVEAAPEDVDVKGDLLARLCALCGERTVLASNTSSIPLTVLASRAAAPERVVGMHFFNPAPRMRLVEIVPAAQTAAWVVELVVRAAEAMGKTTIVAADAPGFVVNRCGRPFYGEALRLLQERVATAAQIDRICRVGAQFKMGPFELMDLVGIDVGYAIAQSFAQRSFGEPRWRPSTLQADKVAAGQLGRKSGRGWYDYGAEAHRPPDPEPPTGVAATAVGSPAVELRALLDAEDGGALDCSTRSLASRRRPSALGFSLVPGSRLVELTRGPHADPAQADRLAAVIAELGFHVEWVADAPGLVLWRMLAQIVNEACFALGEGIATAAEIETGVRLGLNYPKGPLGWGDELGWPAVAATLDGIWQERREERYRPAPALIAAAATGVDPRTPE